MRGPIVLLAACLACSGPPGGDSRTAAADRKSAPARPSSTRAGAGIDSAAFHLEQAALYERYSAVTESVDEFELAAELADQPAQAVTAYAGVARIREAQGDLPAAIEALQQARAVSSDQPATDGEPAMPVLPSLDRRRLGLSLGRLHTELKDFDAAARVYDELLVIEPVPSVGADEIMREQIALYRKAGTLEQRIQDSEKAGSGKKPSELALRFLVQAYSDGSLPTAAMVAPTSPEKAKPDLHLADLARVIERLRGLHPEDAGLHRSLVGLYQQLGQDKRAAALARRAPAEPAAESAPGPVGPNLAVSTRSCQSAPLPKPLAAVEEEINLLAAVGRQADAIATVERLAKGNARRGIARLILASRLYLQLDQIDAAGQVLDRAAALARSPDDRRQLALQRGSWLTAAGKHVEARALYTEWTRSGDTCLEAQASTGLAMLATLTPTAVPE